MRTGINSSRELSTRIAADHMQVQDVLTGVIWYAYITRSRNEGCVHGIYTKWRAPAMVGEMPL